MQFDKRRVLMLLENNPYPQDSRVRQEASSLANAGYRVTVIAPRSPDQTWNETIDSVRVCRFPSPPDANGSVGYLLEYGYAMTAIFVIAFWAYLRDGFDIVHTHCPPDAFVLIAIFFRLLGKKFIYDHHDLSPEMYCARFEGNCNQFFLRALTFLEKLSCRFSDHIIATNQSYKTIEIERGGAPEEGITIVRNGPDLNLLQPTEPIPELQNRASIVIGYVGVMGVQDGVGHLLRALHHLVHDQGKTDFLCVMIGSGEALPSLKILSEQLQITDNVFFTGWINFAEVARYISTIDIAIAPEPSNPYNDRSTFIKVMEYMALGKPIAAFDLPETRFSAQDAASYARPNDESDFALKIAMLMDDTERRKKMGESGRRRVNKVLAWEHQEKHLLEAYRLVVEKI
jgi:glycosyltransferase involved in cell wall biosynthesis